MEARQDWIKVPSEHPQEFLIEQGVDIHPIALLSIADHAKRANTLPGEQVVGTLIGEVMDGTVHITESYAVPFEDDQVVYLNYGYHQKMFRMFKKVNQKDRIVGWYSTGSELPGNALAIHQIYQRECPWATFVLLNLEDRATQGFPVEAYVLRMTMEDSATPSMSLSSVPVRIASLEAEEVGIEELLKEINPHYCTTLGTLVDEKETGLDGVINRIDECKRYIDDVIAEKCPARKSILFKTQNVLNLMAAHKGAALEAEFMRDVNDYALVGWVGYLAKLVSSVHGLIDERWQLKLDAAAGGTASAAAAAATAPAASAQTEAASGPGDAE